MAADRARSASGEIRRDGVTSSDPPLSRATRASDAPKAVASFGGKLEAWLSPPISTARRGPGKAWIRLAKLFAASASRTRVTLCTAPKVLSTLSPLKPSCSGAAIRLK